MILLLARALAIACRGHHELVLENIALRQQLAALKRSGARPRLRQRDRLFWIAMACGVHKFDPLTLHACTRGINRPIDRAAERRPRSVPSISRSDERSITLRAGRS